MKLALVISSIAGGGAERAMSVLASHWAARGDAVTLITFERSTDDYPLDRAVRHVSLELTEDSPGFLDALRNNARRLFRLREVLCAERPDAVVSFEERMNMLVLIATLRSGLHRIVAERSDPRQHRIPPVWAALRRVTYPLADALVVQTEGLRRWGARVTLARTRVHAIPNPVRAMRGYTRIAAGANCRTVVAVGRLIPVKGFDLLLHAFAGLAADFPAMKLVIAGEGPERERLTALARALGIAHRVELPGWLEEPGELLAHADVFVLASRYEGFPNVLLEAMACGVPAIATACAGAVEIVTHETDGLLVPVGSPQALGEALRRLATDHALRERLGARGLAASERFRVETIVQRWDALFPASAMDRRDGALHGAGE